MAAATGGAWAHALCRWPIIDRFAGTDPRNTHAMNMPQKDVNVIVPP